MGLSFRFKPMNKFIIIIICVLILIGVLFLTVSFKNDIETPEYTVIKKYEDVEIRLYPKMIVAKTKLENKSYEKAASKGFRTIAGYIFGGNENQQKIAMTAPVVMNLSDSATMYFVMPKKYGIHDLPKPSGQDVIIEEEVSKTLAVIRFGGYSSDKKIKNYCQKLEDVLRKNNIKTHGNYLFMGYNAPWDFINRRNEVAIEVIQD